MYQASMVEEQGSLGFVFGSPTNELIMVFLKLRYYNLNRGMGLRMDAKVLIRRLGNPYADNNFL